MTTVTYQVKTKQNGLVTVEWTFQNDKEANKFAAKIIDEDHKRLNIRIKRKDK